MATILFDDNTDALVFRDDAVYEILVSDNFVGGSAVAVSSGSLDFTFSGISIALFGRINRNDSSLSTVPAPNIREILVDGIPIESNVHFPDEVAIRLIYQLPRLSDTKHILTLSNVSSIILDFIEVTAGNTTYLAGSTLLLNSGDSAISYEGNWTCNDTILVDDAHQFRQPIGGTTRDTSSGDASATVSFTGTSISVLGAYYSDLRASYSPTFYVDGKEQSHQSPRRSGPNYPWFSSQQFSNGNHVLKIDLSGNTAGAHFSLEYITYTASFENLDTNSRPIPASVFIGVGAGVGVIVIGILLVILVWWKRRRPRRRLSETASTSTATFGLSNPVQDPGLMNQLVEKSSLQAYSAQFLTPYDFPMFRTSTRHAEITTSETLHVPGIDDHSTQIQGPSPYQVQRITPLVPRRKGHQEEKLPHHNKLSKENRTSNQRSTETIVQIQQLQQMMLQLQRDIAPPGVVATNSQSFNGDLRADPLQDAVNGTGTDPRTTHNGHMAEGSYGMRVQQLEELMRELREGTAHSELGQEQVGTGHSMILAGLMEEMLELQRNQSRGGERSPVTHRTVV